MSRRTLALLLIAGAIIALLAILWWLLFSEKRPIAQPPLPTPSGSQTQNPSVVPAIAPKSTSPVQSPPVVLEEETLKTRAMQFVSRVDSYSNTDRFESLKSVYVDATTSVQAFLESQRKASVAAHPASGTYFGVTGRAVSAKIIKGTPLATHTEATVVVQVQETRMDGDATSIGYEQATLIYTKSGNGWFVSHLDWAPFTP